MTAGRLYTFLGAGHTGGTTLSLSGVDLTVDGFSFGFGTLIGGNGIVVFDRTLLGHAVSRPSQRITISNTSVTGFVGGIQASLNNRTLDNDLTFDNVTACGNTQGIGIRSRGAQVLGGNVGGNNEGIRVFVESTNVVIDGVNFFGNTADVVDDTGGVGVTELNSTFNSFNCFVPGPVTLSIDDVDVLEGSGSANLTVVLDIATASDVSVDFATADGTAAAPEDYMATSGTATIAAGSLSTTIIVAVIDDAVAEPDETFTVTLSNPLGAVISTIADIATVTIIDDDSPIQVVALNEENASGQSGVAVLRAKGAQTEVTLTLLTGTLATELVHIHSGSCGDGLGGVVHPLTSFVGGAGGSVTTVDATLASLRTGDFAINSHQLGNPGVYTTCGNIPIEADSITIALDEQNASGQSGWASLTARGSATEVAFWISDGTLESELVHIHSGTCGNDTLGGVVHPLSNVASGISATLVEATFESLRAGDFAVNTHEKGNPGVYTTCGNIPSRANSLTIALGELNNSSQRGFASLTARGTATEVLLHLSPGALQTELVHIHSGQCGATLGDVVYPLTSFAGGAGGSSTTVQAEFLSLRTDGFAINAHQKDNPSVYTACGNIPGGTVPVPGVSAWGLAALAAALALFVFAIGRRARERQLSGPSLM